MTTLFAGWEDGELMIEFPSSVGSEAVKALMEQLAIWSPDAPKTKDRPCYGPVVCRTRVPRSRISHGRKDTQTIRLRRRGICGSETTVSLLDAQAHQLWKPVGA